MSKVKLDSDGNVVLDDDGNVVLIDEPVPAPIPARGMMTSTRIPQHSLTTRIPLHSLSTRS